MGVVFSKMEVPLLTTPYLATILRAKSNKISTKDTPKDKDINITATVAQSNVINDPGAGKRVKNQWYSTKKYGTVRWLGTYFSCKHGRARSKCKECGGSSICEHGRVRSQCKECGGSQICEHGRQRSQCKDCWANRLTCIKCQPCKT